MTNDYSFSDSQLNTKSNLDIASGAAIDELLREEFYSSDPVLDKAPTSARWGKNPMHDGNETKRPRPETAAAQRKGFLPDVSLPSPLPPEPVAISDMANMFGVTHRTLHFYEEKAIISPRRAGLMRIYSHEDVRRMAVVNFCRDIGVPVAVIQDVMEKLAKAESQTHADAVFQDLLNSRKSELVTEISTVRRQIQQISDVLLVDDASVDADIDTFSEAIELTDQERKCLELMADGYAPVRLARTLGISNEELQKLEASVMEKVSANNRFQAVAKAYMLGVIQQDRAAVQ